MIPARNLLLALLAGALAVSAQSDSGSATTEATSSASGSGSAPVPSGTAGISPCILQCVTQAASQGGCSSFADLTCVCTSEAFQNAARDCLQTTCTQEEVQAALQLQQQQCAAVSGAPSGSGSAPATSAATSAASSTATVPTSGSTTRPVSSGASSSGLASSSTSTGAPNPSGSSAAGHIEAYGFLTAFLAGLLGLTL